MTDAPISTLIAGHVPLKRWGKTGRLLGRCPFHTEKTPSFTVDDQAGSFHCMGCGLWGDPSTFQRLIAEARR